MGGVSDGDRALRRPRSPTESPPTAWNSRTPSTNLPAESEDRMLNHLRGTIVGLVLSQGTLVMAGETSLPRDVQRINNPAVEESDVVRLIERLRASPPTDEEAKLLRQIANSNTQSDIRRRRAVLQLFDRHVRTGMRVGELGGLLANPSWLKKENVVEVRVVAGLLPVRIVPGETIFVIVPRLPPEDKSTGVYLRVEGSASPESLYDALLGKKTKAATARISTIAILAPSLEDQKLIDARGMVKGGDVGLFIPNMGKEREENGIGPIIAPVQVGALPQRPAGALDLRHLREQRRKGINRGKGVGSLCFPTLTGSTGGSKSTSTARARRAGIGRKVRIRLKGRIKGIKGGIKLPCGN